MKKYQLFFCLALINLFPLLALAQGSGETGSGNIITNPLKVESLTELLALVLDIIVQVGLVVIVFFIIFAGFKYVTAQGNTSEITKAHNALMATLIGSAIVLGSYAIAKALDSTVKQLRQGVYLEETIKFKV
jgi:hypothetical protein